MRIALATPFHERSAIGRFGLLVGEELASRDHEVEILRLEAAPDLAEPAIATALVVRSVDEAALESYDHILLNLGNHAPYHAQAATLLARAAPVGIFHDAEYRDWEWGMLHRHGLTIPRLPGLPNQLSSDTDPLLAAEGRSLLATLAGLCSAAVVHGPHYLRTVEQYCPGPVGMTALCWPDPAVGRPLRARAPGCRRIVMFGVISEHKQPGRVLEALAGMDSKFDPIELHLAGPIEDGYRATLEQRARSLGVPEPVIHGRLSEEDLQDLIESAHAVCCLRYPVTEGGSASLATALHRGRPVIVSDVASFALAPDHLVTKVSYGADPIPLRQALERILSDQENADRQALEAQAWAERAYSVEAYVDFLLPFLKRTRGAQALTQAARGLASTLGGDDQGLDEPSLLAFARNLDWIASEWVDDA